MRISDMTAEQQKAVNYSDGSLIVSASAGSGKTLVMITRIIRLIKEKKASVKEILAMTFTESAAAEMKEKLSSSLTEAYAETGDKYIAEQISEVSASDISTVHSFCSKLIRNYFFEADVSPDYAIADEKQAFTLKQTAVDTAIKQMYEQGDIELIRFAGRYAKKRSDRFLKEKIIKAFDFFREEAYPDEAMEKCLFKYTEKGYEETLKEYKQLIDKSILLIKESLLEIKIEAEKYSCTLPTVLLIENLISRCDEILSKGDVYALNDCLEAISLPLNRKIEIEEKLLRERLKGFRQKIFAILDRTLKNFTSDEKEREKLCFLYSHAKCFIKLIRSFGDIYNELKKEENVLDFSDLQHYAIKVLLNKDVRKEVRSRFKYVLIDEYQDTNATQEEIINLLASDNLFMVGDEKQSIYGFRGCRPEFFHNKFLQFEKEGRAVSLNSNFRSAKEVIDGVNKVFSYCMTDSVYGLNYKDKACLLEGGVYPQNKKGSFSVHRYIEEKTEKKKESPRIYDVLEELSQKDEGTTAQMITKIINSELGKTYYDFKEKKDKIIGFKDIAVLSRRKKEDYLMPIIRGLRLRGIPVTGAISENICDYAEIRQLISALELIVCMKNDIALATVMKSPVGGFLDEDLLKISLFYKDNNNGKREDFYTSLIFFSQNGEGELKDKICKFFGYFDKLRFVSDFISAHDILVRIIEENNIEAYHLATRGGANKIKRIHRLLSFAGVGDKKLSAQEFIKKIKETDKLELTCSSEDEDSVKIMTVHASKGLEYPVVIVCDAESHFNAQDDREEIYLDRNYGFVTKFYNDQNRTCESTLLRGLVKERFQENRLKEEMRLFYVAMTRAKYSLHLLYSGDISRDERFLSANSFVGFLPPNLEESTYTFNDLVFENAVKEPIKVIIGEENKTETQRLNKNFAYLYPFIEDTLLPLKTNVTKATAKEEYHKVIRLFDEEEEKNRVSRELAIEKGNTAHKIMEFLDFESSVGVEDQVNGFIRDEILSKEEVDKISINSLERVINSPIFDKIKSKNLFREKGFLAFIPASKVIGASSDTPVLVQGIIDLLAIDGNDAYIFDYKYSKSQANDLKIRYQKQLELYSYAVEKVLKIKVKSKTLINLLSGEIVEID